MGPDQMRRSATDTTMQTEPQPLRDESAEPQLDEVRYEVAFEFAPDCQVLTDGEGLILNVNHAAAALLRSRKEFLVGKPLGLFVAEGHRPRFYESLSRLWQGVASDGFETQVAPRGEESRYVLVMAFAEVGRSFFRWLFRDVTDLKRAEADRAELLRRVVTAQEDERRRVARDLHDNIGQLLTALSLGLKSVEEAGPLPPAAIAPLELVRRVTKELSRAVRNLVLNLRPVALDDLGLQAALGQLLSDWSAQQPGIAIDFQADALVAARLPPEVETAIYRVVQEALTNVFQHAHARRVRVVMEWQEGLVTAMVQDDGVGFDPQAAADSATDKRLGLIGMRERAALAGGSLQIVSRPGGGTTVIARFPVPCGEEAIPEDSPE
jgi:PAS domain S-box-containing protein